MSITAAVRFAVLDRDGFRCVYCGQTAENQRLQVDHIEPRAKGGGDEPSNLVTACWDCNVGKSDRRLSKGSYELIRGRAGELPRPRPLKLVPKATLKLVSIGVPKDVIGLMPTGKNSRAKWMRAAFIEKIEREAAEEVSSRLLGAETQQRRP